jgi:hypothetical protein
MIRIWQHIFALRKGLPLTPLIWEHANPYRRFELDMTTRLPIG